MAKSLAQQLSLAIPILLAGCYSPVYLSKLDPLPKKYVDKLVVNRSEDFRTRAYMSESEGVEQIRSLVNSSLYEEAWAYLPKKKLWIEVGRKEDYTLEMRNVRENEFKPYFISSAEIDHQCLSKILTENSHVVLYHFHPKSNVELEELIAQFEKERGEHRDVNQLKEITDQWNYNADLLRDIPSEGDIEQMINTSNAFYEVKPRGKLDFKICTPKGVVSYHLTSKGISLYRTKSEEEIKEQSEEFRWGRSTELTNPLELAKFITNEYIEIKFLPYSKK